MIRAYIMISLYNGKTYKYVNVVTQDSNGKDGLFYSYTNEAGDTYAEQIGAGKIKGDFDNIVAQLNGTGLLIFPEGGTLLVRKNKNQNLASNSNTMSSIKIPAIANIDIIENRTNEWEDIEIERSV